MKEKIIGLYPGSFDPMTNGHTDIIARATKIVDHLFIGIAENDEKKHLFTLSERKDLVQTELKLSNKIPTEKVSVVAFKGLLMHFAQKVDATVIIRGLRAISDFDYEFQMTGMNARLNSEIETIFLMASEKQQFISSRFVKEICKLDGDIASFAPERVCKALIEKFKI